MNNRKRTKGRHIQYVEVERQKEKRPPKPTDKMGLLDTMKEVMNRVYGNRIGPRRFKRIFHQS